MTNWRPISEYDDMDPADRPRLAVFYYPSEKSTRHNDLGFPSMTSDKRRCGNRTCTLWLPLDDPGQTIDDNYPFDAVAR